MSKLFNTPKKFFVSVLCIAILSGGIVLASVKANAGLSENKTIGLEKGVNVALQDAGFSEDKVSNLIASYDSEDGMQIYEIEFKAASYKYEYTVKAADGAILEASREEIKEKVTDDSGKADKKQESTSESNTNKPASQSTSQQTTTQQTTSAQASAPESKYIGVDKAKALALKNAGVSASAVTFTKAKLDRDDGIAIYEIEFHTDSIEYEYEIKALTGDILEKNCEQLEKDDYDDLYDDDDDDHDDDEWDD